MFKHLYIHIPFCNSICTFCDFVRFEKCGEKVKEKYVEYLLSEIKKIPKGKLDSIYLGGGTPNSLPLKMMEKLLESLQRLINKDTEFTIELNPELLTQAQCDLFIKYQINRISLGAQIMNDKVLKIYHRAHDTKKIKSAVNLLEKNNFQNISLDFIYGFNEMGEKDLKKEINYITNCKAIKHVSFYSLEVKENSIIAKQNYELNEQKVEDEFAFIIDELKKNKWKRYEVSSWTKNKKFVSKHNIGYWNTEEWRGIGIGAFGYESKTYYHYEGKLDNISKIEEKMNDYDFYFQIISMGLRLVEGINLSIPQNQKAYEYFKQKIGSNVVITKNNFLKAKNINLLNEILIELL